MMIVLANEGYVFGGYNPTSWVNSFGYSDEASAFLFSVCDKARQRPPFKCLVKKVKSEFAIK
eukprot:CAMPEP_0170562714 /NCGR_PEP_ID=MMETSP0211-20121228/62115_1 /TAXON_ID=311385 /ORGANISM="Pseudokeronopsis sp., Strain OXSARD2" /LENGTH=61 /DNA_ID=CAMNT_0010879981 /DNA_START=35 /DNA_END=220 /DNA_ORIENTATION=-